MGWMHDALEYFSHDPVHRRFHHNELTFRGVYAFTENFELPLSHDEVVHGKGSLIRKMPGDDWQKFANLRLLLAFQWLSPGKKLLFMGCEIAQWSEWNHEQSLDWHLLEQPHHQGMQRLVSDLNRAYRQESALHRSDCEVGGFEWIDANDSEQSTLTFLRSDPESGETCLVACNFTPLPRHNFRVGAPRPGRWSELMNSDAPEYGGSGQGNLGGADTVPVAAHGRPQSLVLTLPPLAAVVLKAPALKAAGA
jgi:1,4-alpha-glucan branching enzyme